MIQFDNLSIRRGENMLFDGASFQIHPGQKVGLTGANGCGKSSLFAIFKQELVVDKGDIKIPRDWVIAHVAQEAPANENPAIEHVLDGDKEWRDLEQKIQNTDHPRFLKHQSRYEEIDGYSARSRAAQLLNGLGFKPQDIEKPTKEFSGGWRVRLNVAKALMCRSDLLLLDEPTNHLDLPAIEWLEETLNNLNSAVVVISHDRRFLKSVTTRTVWIDRGDTRNLDRGFSAFEEWRDKVLEDEELERHKLDRKIVAEEHWVRYGVTARRKRNVRRMRDLGELRRQRLEEQKTPGKVKFTTSTAAPSGKRVITAEHLSKSYGDSIIVDGFSMEIVRGDRIGFVGPNGAGKTTLINLLTGMLPPDQGKITFGANLDIITLDQRRASLKDEMRVADAITDGRGDFVMIGESKKHVSTYLKDFLFSSEQWRAKVATLSGGERGRLVLAAALAKPSNLLVLDEPTNDLDLETLELLEEVIADYDGTLLLVSHDRSFLDRLVTSIVTTAPNRLRGQWVEYIGGYNDMVSQRGGTLGVLSTPTPQPKKTNNTKEKTAPKTGVQKLSYKEKYALENLPREMTALEANIAKAKNSLADPTLFDTDPDKFSQIAATLEQAESRLAAAEEEWLELEIKRESLEAE